jgi:flagellin FlaB
MTMCRLCNSEHDIWRQDHASARSRQPAGNARRGITGLETAIVLIAFVVVAAVLAFTVLSTGVFSSERGRETVFSGLRSVKGTLKPAGSVIAFRGKIGSSNAVFKFSLLVENPADGEKIDLTPPFTANNTGTDPDSSSTANTTVLTYQDSNQALTEVPWSSHIFGIGTDNILDPGEKAEIVVWLLNRNTATQQDQTDSAAYMSAGSGGITSSGTLVNENDSFTITLQPSTGTTMTWTRTLPSKFDAVMSLK